MLISKLLPLAAALLCLGLGHHALAADTQCLTVETPGQDRRTDKSRLRFVHYNVEWFFIDYYSGADCPGDGCPWNNETAAETHMYYLSTVINNLQPDILNLAEIEGCDEMEKLENFIGDEFKGYLIKGTDSATGQNVGLMTKVDPSISLYRSEDRATYPVPNSKCGSPYDGDTGVSKNYITEFAINGGELNLALIGVHLKAFPTDPPSCAQREGQAQVLSDAVASYVARGFEVILVGDMNDYDPEVPDVNDNQPTSMALGIMKGMAGTHAGEYALINIASSLPQSARYSEWWDSDNNCATNSIADYSMIDHVLITPRLQDRIANVFIYHNYTGSCDSFNSDHYPVVVDFIM